MASHPFLSPAFHIAWSQLKPEHVVPDIEAGLTRAEAALASIVARDLRELTYENTFLALERATEELSMAWTKVTHLQSVADAPALRDAHNAMLPKVSAIFAKIPLNPDQWLRLRTVAESAAGARADRDSPAVCGRDRGGFPAGGRGPAAGEARADRGTPKRARAADAEIFGKRARCDERLAIGRGGRVPARRPAPAREGGGAQQRRDKGSRLGWRFTLHMPSQEPFMTYLDDGDLRKEMWTAAIAVGAAGAQDNTALIARILALRAEKAALLGKVHFADLVLERRMAKNGARALAFVEDFQKRAAPAFARECRALEEFKAQQTGGKVARLAPWEVAYWAEKLRQASYAFDEEVQRPYFPMDRVIAGMFELATRIFGLRITERSGIDVWHPEVKFYDVMDSRGRTVGSFYADWYPRESKRGGAWMNYLLTGGPGPGGARAPHLGLICGNMTPPAAGKAALLKHREVETVFHEFGHLLHHLLGEVEIKSLNGVNVAWDFVELPSQIMENWCWERAGLDLFARHHETGGPIPEEIFKKMTAAKNFRSASATMRQVALAKMDLLLHIRTAEFAGAPDVEVPLPAAAIADCLVPTEPPAPTIVKRFTHIFADPVGYAAGYYSYKWAEVLDADAFTRFRREGIFSARRRRGVRGQDPQPRQLGRPGWSCYRAFMGRDPDPNALLVRAGLAAA